MNGLHFKRPTVGGYRWYYLCMGGGAYHFFLIKKKKKCLVDGTKPSEKDFKTFCKALAPNIHLFGQDPGEVSLCALKFSRKTERI